ncbi:hypothetical protein HD806DRAFT_549465 [Xylariaceae sp. AK1471]|nr:hypothetical protein HD806DRAFT_549465 [Xylariaceae sp. AK1471]
MSLHAMNENGALWYYQWLEAAVQVDGPTSLIKISSSTFSTLGEIGEAFFKEQASMLLNKPTDFLWDSRNMNRIYLANEDDIRQQLSCTLEFTGSRYLTLVPVPTTQVTMANTAHYPTLGHNPSSRSYGLNNVDLSAPNSVLSSSIIPDLQSMDLSTPALSTGPPRTRKRKTPDYRAPQGLSKQAKIISAMWKDLSLEQKTPWMDRADALRLEHSLRYPDYKYIPDMEKARRRKAKKQASQAASAPGPQGQEQLPDQFGHPEALGEINDEDIIQNEGVNQYPQQDHTGPYDLSEYVNLDLFNFDL